MAETAEHCESSHEKPGTEANKPFGGYTWRIIPVSKWLVNPIYKSFSPFGRGTTPVSGLTNHDYHLLTGMILQAVGSGQQRWLLQTERNEVYGGVSLTYSLI